MTRVVVTGLGALTPIGIGVPAMLEGLRTGRRGFDRCDRFATDGLRSQIAAQLSAFPAEPAALDPTARLALAAGREALADAGLALDGEDRWRAGFVLGTCLGGLASLERYVLESDRRPELIFQYPPPVITGLVAGALGLWGESRTVISACSAGTNAIGIALDLIRDGACDVVLAGGADPLCAVSFAGFSAMEALDPDGCRPFDQNRDGITLGEGAAMLVLESEDRALLRGARIYAAVLGHGAVNDAYHTTAPEPSGEGALRAMLAALADASVGAGAIGYVNAHGTGTRANDEMEVLALDRLFDGRPVPVSATKSQIGHTLGAAGSIEAVACCLALYHALLPMTVGLRESVRADWDFVGQPGRKAEPKPTLSNSFAFAGNMASLVLAPYREAGRADA